VFLGELEIVKKHFELVVLAVIGVSILPIVVEILKNKLSKKPSGTQV
jgi:membrane-associated protein